MPLSLIPSYDNPAVDPSDPGGSYGGVPTSTYIPGTNVAETSKLQQSMIPELKAASVPEWRSNLSQLLMIAGLGLEDVYNKTDNSTKAIMAYQQSREAGRLMKLQMAAMKGLAQIDVMAKESPDRALAAYDQFIQAAPEQLDPKVIQYAMNARQILATSVAFVKTTAGLPTGQAKADFIRSAAVSAGRDFPALAGHILNMANTIEASKGIQAHINEGSLVTWDPKNPQGTLKAVPIPGLTARDTRPVEEKKLDAFAAIYAGESFMGLVQKAQAGGPESERAKTTLSRIMSESEKDPKLNSERDVMAVAMYGPVGKKARNPSVVDLGSLAKINPVQAQDVIQETMLMQEKAKGDVAYRIALAQIQAKDTEEPDPAKYRYFNRAKLIKGYAAEEKFGTIGEAKKSVAGNQAVRVSADEAKAIKATEGMNAVIDTMERVGRGLSPQAGWGVLVQSLTTPVLQYLGVAGTPTELGVMQAYNLRFAKILQSAGGSGGGQVSDADARAAAMANISKNDSVASVMIKVNILRKLNHVNMLLEAGLSPRDMGITAFSDEGANTVEKQLRGVVQTTTRQPSPSDWKPVRR